jgi:hypothetical protein
MDSLASWALGLAMLAAFLLVIGGAVLVRREADRKRGLLMFVAAAVLVANVAIWTV